MTHWTILIPAVIGSWGLQFRFLSSESHLFFLIVTAVMLTISYQINVLKSPTENLAGHDKKGLLAVLLNLLYSAALFYNYSHYKDDIGGAFIMAISAIFFLAICFLPSLIFTKKARGYR